MNRFRGQLSALIGTLRLYRRAGPRGLVYGLWSLRAKRQYDSLEPGVVTVMAAESDVSAEVLETTVWRGLPIVDSVADVRRIVPGEPVVVSDPALIARCRHAVDLHLLRLAPPSVRDPGRPTTIFHAMEDTALSADRAWTNSLLVGQTHRIHRLHQWEIDEVSLAHPPRDLPPTLDRPWLADPLGRIHLPPRAEAVRLERPVGVFIHLFHADLAPDLRALMERIDHPMALHVSTDTQEKAASLATVFPEADIAVLPNRGRDVRPKFYGFPGAHDAHDVVLHLHAKRSPHLSDPDAWTRDITDSLLGSRGTVRRVLEMFSELPQLGVVAPAPYDRMSKGFRWRNNRVIAEILGWEAGLQPLPDDHDLRFPAGSIFWARTAALRPLLDLHLTPEQFPLEAGQGDGTPAHALERLVGVACLNAGLDLVLFDGRETSKDRPGTRTFSSSADLGDFLAEKRRGGSAAVTDTLNP